MQKFWGDFDNSFLRYLHLKFRFFLKLKKFSNFMENLKLDDSFRGPKQSLYDQDCITVFIRMNGF